MTALVVLLACAVWLLACALVVTSHKLRLERLPKPGLARNPARDRLPISLALYGAWTARGELDPVAYLRVVAEVRRLHPDLGAALDRAVQVYTDRANREARRPVSPEVMDLPPATTAPPGRYGTTPALEACNRGEHAWRPVEELGVDRCEACGAMRGVA